MCTVDAKYFIKTMRKEMGDCKRGVCIAFNQTCHFQFFIRFRQKGMSLKMNRVPSKLDLISGLSVHDIRMFNQCYKEFFLSTWQYTQSLISCS